ncbi:PhoH family protein [Desulfurococcus mucosus]|uniref:PhoH family protein n=1 Tax=Desulfurococcus mucosus (strain ATCC 35584 / DSM 2162 / JCM 9187 / O7/1) TaxID=765177 RepID=E8R963_DESM0|nr:PhoH family protein [Desulfurococcus mucosus]ADV65039.1 PhoH family protein [Desulfurococcus mucosus DSM 2162]
MATNVFGKISPQTPGQEEIVNALSDKRYEIIGLFGPTGSGKSLISILYGVDSVLNNRYKRFIISRPLIDVVSGKELTAADLGDSYYQLASSYIQDITSGVVEWSLIRELMEKGLIVIADSHYLRGRTFDDSIIFLDDAQSIPVESAIEIVMRIGRNSRLIIAGDPVFQRTVGSRDSASMLREILLGEDSAKVIDLGLKDIVRPGARRGIKLLLESRMRARVLNEAEKQVIDAARVRAPDADIVTVVEFVELKKHHGITGEGSPDAVIIVKEGYIGRLVGKGGERITGIEKDTGYRLRAVELSLDFKPLIRAIHPVSWIHKHIVDADFAGPNLAVKVTSEGYGAFVGQKGSHIRFLEDVMKKLLGVGVRAYEVEAKEEKKRKK